MRSSWSLLPRTRAGWASLALVGVLAASIAIMVGVDANWRIGRLNVWGAFNFALVLAAGALALNATLRRGERSLAVLVTIVLAVLALASEILLV